MDYQVLYCGTVVVVEIQQIENRENRIFWCGFEDFCIGTVRIPHTTTLKGNTPRYILQAMVPRTTIFFLGRDQLLKGMGVDKKRRAYRKQC